MFPDAVRDLDTWHVAAPRRKYHAACGYIHSPVDVVAAMRREGADFSSAARIDVGVAELTIPAVSKDRPPTTGNAPGSTGILRRAGCCGRGRDSAGTQH